MESFPGIVRQIVLCVFSPLLGACVLAWVLLQLQTFKSRMWSKLGRSVCAGLVSLAIVCTTLIGKNTNGVNGVGGMPLMQFNPPAVRSVTPEDISNGWRVAEVSGTGTFAPPPANAVTNERWRLRGAHDDALRIPADGWLYPFASGVTVLSRGEIRKDIRSRDFPRAFEQDLSLLPVVKWQLLPAGRNESVFWHGSTPSNTLIATWWNAVLGREATNPVCFQAELYTNGGFDYRYEDRTVRHVRVWPFDLDDDGLENSVDPDPLVAGPDAHGTNAEWYNTVCSNVLEAVASGSTGTTGILPVGNGGTGATGILPVDDDCVLSWRADVNSNAYYFVDVVAERGPAPIYFTGDRDSRLGNPVVVALAGVTNRVPLLIGVDYAVTSDTPFTVSFPIDYIHPTVTTNDVADYNVRWPLNFVFTESLTESNRVYTVTVEPYDPGGAFTSDPPLRGAPCGCVSFSGNAIVFGCSPACDCGGICKKGILYYLLGGAAFAATGGVCRCGFEDPVPPDPVAHDPTNAPALSITFSKPAVIFEEAYLDSEHGVMPKRSTRVQLTVSAYGGAHGGSLALSSQNLERLSAVAGGMIDLPAITNIVPYESFFSTCAYEAADVSGSTNDIKVSGTFTENEASTAYHSEASLTAVKLEFTPNYSIDNCPHRHRVGVRETAKCSWMPADVAVICEAGTGGQSNLADGEWHYVAPLTADAPPYLTAVCQGVRYQLALDVVEPQSVVVRSAEAFDYGVPTNVAGGAGMDLELVILPTNVSFTGIAVQEVPSDYKDPQGYFANAYFDFAWSHTTNMRAGVWHDIHAHNYFMNDYAEMGDRLPGMTASGEITDEDAYGWIAGTMNWFIPVGWNENGSDATETPVKLFCVYWQRFRMASDGTLEVEKFDNVVQRKTNTVVRLNGKIVPLRPR